MLNLKDLKSALAKVADLSNTERSFLIKGEKITLRVLTPNEEIEVQKRAMEAIKEGEDTNQVVAADYIQRFRTHTLSYAIIQINELDLRDVKYIETDETLPNGVKIKITKHEALESIISSWGREMLSAVFKKFGELSEAVEADVEESVVYEPEILEKEIERLEQRLVELKNKRESKDETDPTAEVFSNNLNAVDELDQNKITPESVLTEKTNLPIQPSKPRASAIPVKEAPPLNKEPNEPHQAEPQAEPQAVAKYNPRHDQEYLKEVEDEQLRLLRERQERQEKQQTPESIEGVEVYRMPTQTLDNRAPQQQNTSKPNYNPDHSKPSNPNFKMSR